MVALGTCFAAALFVGVFALIGLCLQGQGNRKVQKMMMRKRRADIRNACRKSIKTLSNASEIEIVPPRHNSGRELNWQHPLTNFSHRSRFQSSVNHR